MKNSFYIYYFICIFILFVIFPQIRVELLLLSWLYVFFDSLINIRKKITLCAFYVTFFTFLMGRLVLPLFSSIKPDYHENMSGFKPELWDFIYLVLIIALFTIHLGFNYGEGQSRKSISNKQDELYVNKIRRLCSKFVFVTFAFKIITTLEIVRYVFNNGYLALYLEPPHELPYIVYKCADLFVLFVYVFLATLPNKKTSKYVLVCYMVDATLSIFTGRRGTFMFSALLIGIYIYIRNKLSPEEKWISKRTIRLLLLSLPFVLIGMYFIGYVRAEVDIESNAPENPLLSFFYSQGGSVQLIGLTKLSEDHFPSSQYYLPGPLLHIFDGTTIGNVFGLKELEPQSTELAMKGDCLGDYLTYKYNSTRYFYGGGYGGCYLAEAYADLGFVGVVLVSFLFGWLLSKFRYWLTSNVWFSTISFYILFGILHSPRGQAFIFLKEMLTPTVLIVVFIIHTYASNISNKRKIVS